MSNARTRALWREPVRLAWILAGIAAAGSWGYAAVAKPDVVAAPTSPVAATARVAPAPSTTTVASAPSTTTVTPAPSTTTVAPAPQTTGTTAAPLPVPEPAPVDPYADVPLTDVGTIRIPKIGLEATMREGVWLTVIDEGPAHWPGTAMPGGWGNVVVAGHRVTHSHPFRDLDLLAPGDEISFTLPDGSNHTYRMTEQLIVDPSEVWIVDQAPGRTLTLFACHPKGSARQRIVVRGEWVSSTPAP